jgi:ribosome biogenesis protein UTP30
LKWTSALCQDIAFKKKFELDGTPNLEPTIFPIDNMALAKRPSADLTHPLDSSQTLRASTALLRKIEADKVTRESTSTKPDLLAGADEDEAAEDVPIWLVLTTKKHIIDKKRLKPGKIHLPHPYLDTSNKNLRICLITADPQRTYKDLIAHPTFPLDLSKKIGRVIGLTKLKSKYKSFEARRQLLGEYDVFLADDRIITHLPQVLGKVFYKGGSKRPVPVSLEGRKQNFDEQGNKRRKIAEGGTKVVKEEVQPAHVAKEIERALSSALVHLAPSTTTAVKVGKSSMKPQQIQDNIEAVTEALVEKYVPQKWNNVRAVHMKGPNTIALPIWLAEELWQDERDVLDEPLPVDEGKKSKKRKRGVLDGDAAVDEQSLEIIEVPGPDGKMRRLERKSISQKTEQKPPKPSKKRKSDADVQVDAKAVERAQKAARKEALQRQKASAKNAANSVVEASEFKENSDGRTKLVRKARMKAADLM